MEDFSKQEGPAPSTSQAEAHSEVRTPEIASECPVVNLPESTEFSAEVTLLETADSVRIIDWICEKTRYF